MNVPMALRSTYDELTDRLDITWLHGLQHPHQIELNELLEEFWYFKLHTTESLINWTTESANTYQRIQEILYFIRRRQRYTNSRRSPSS